MASYVVSHVIRPVSDSAADDSCGDNRPSESCRGFLRVVWLVGFLRLFDHAPHVVSPGVRLRDRSLEGGRGQAPMVTLHTRSLVVDCDDRSVFVSQSVVCAPVYLQTAFPSALSSRDSGVALI